MGVRGLSSFIDSRTDLTKSHKLHDCSIVIDGNNLLHFLYSSRKINCVLGGDYCRYALEVENFFSAFKTCNIKPYVILDGARDKSDRFFREQFERWRERYRKIESVALTGGYTTSILPINALTVLKDVLTKLNIPFAMCEYEGDAETASIANYFQCPVLSDDSDFYILNLKNGFVKLSSLDQYYTRSSLNPDAPFFKCKIYHIDNLLSYYPALDGSYLPLFASIAGNDYVSYDTLKVFNYNIGHLPGNRFERILHWLSQMRSNEVIANALQLIDEPKRKEFKTLVEGSLETYKLKNTHSIFILENTLVNLEIELSRSTKLVCPCGAALPIDFIVDFNRGNIPPYFMDIMNFHRSLLKNQVENKSYPSTLLCSRAIRQVIYSILFQHEDLNSSAYHEAICKRPVVEYSIEDGLESSFEVTAIYNLPSGKSVPTLNEVYTLSKEEKIIFLAEVMGVTKSFLKRIPPCLQFLFGCLNYWLKNSIPKPSKEFLVSIILNIIYYNVLQEPILMTSITYSQSADHSKIAKVLRKILETDILAARKKIKKYSRCIIFDENNIFDVSIVHCYSQLQSCLHSLNSLNELLKLPLKPLKYHKIFEGTMLYNLTSELMLNQKPDKLVDLLLGRDSACNELLSLLLEKVLRNIPPDFAWDTKNRTKRKSIVNTTSTMKLANKFRGLNIDES